jgi:nucleoside-diphosphate-sugar epimerase
VSPSRRLALFGSTGQVGRHVVEQALAAGDSLTVLVRDPARLGDAAAKVEVVVGDALDGDAVDRTIGGATAVISTLGPGSLRKEGPGPEATPKILAAMRHHGVRRYLTVFSASMPLPSDRPRGRGDRMAAKVMGLRAGPMIRGHLKEYALLSASDVAWTAVRPPLLVAGAATGRWDVGLDVPPVRGRIPFTDVAAFLLSEVESDTWVGQAPFLRSPDLS